MMIDGLLFVLDTNVLVSSIILPGSIAYRVLARVLELGRLLVSEETAAELAEVLDRRKFDRYLTPEAREEFVADLTAGALIVEVAESVLACRDPKDDKFLSLAVAGGAVCIISGDADLLVLHPFRGIPIFTPRAFLERAW